MKKKVARSADSAQAQVAGPRELQSEPGAGEQDPAGAPFDSTPSATFATAPESLAISDQDGAIGAEGVLESTWWDNYQHHWLKLTLGRRWQWHERSKDKKLDAGKRRYAGHRARAMSMDTRARLGECGERCAVIQCGCRRVVAEVGCRQRWLCERCRLRHARRMRRRLHRSCRIWEKTARGRSWRLMTFTPPEHSGDIALDHRRIGRAWRKWQQWLARQVGKFPYALVWEVTEGNDGRGHVHAHVVALLPFFDYRAALDRWRAEIGRADAQWDCQKATKGPGGAAEYVAKYVSKGSNPGVFTPELAARTCAAFYGKRLVTASHGFWFKPPPECKKCGELYKLVLRPGNLPGALPWEAWRALARRNGVQSNRNGWLAQTEFG